MLVLFGLFVRCCLPLQFADVVICGAGLAGISAAYHLAVRHQAGRILLVDERPPLTLTSDKSTEGYRNWWPGPPASRRDVQPGIADAMVRLTGRSIDILEDLARQSGNAIHLNRRGYLYVTGDPGHVAALRRSAEEVSALGAGPLRIHSGAPGEPVYVPAPPEGFEGQPAGADLIADSSLLRTQFPYLAEGALAALHVRRAGWLSAQQLGMYLLEQARDHGVELVRARLTGVELARGRVAGVCLAPVDGRPETTVATECFVNAAGPLCAGVARLVGVDLPVFAELHVKVAFNDTHNAVPRAAPLIIWDDAQRLDWTSEERAALAESPETAWLLDELPAGAHLRPEGGPGSPVVLMLWAYHTPPVTPSWPLAYDARHAEITLRGVVRLLPGLQSYLGRLPRPWIDGGYYLKTRENRPLIGPLPVPGAYLIAALSGFGVMTCCGAGELLAAHVTGTALPAYARAFALERYADPAYCALLAEWEATGQL
jgi:sarcosine oxidase, subunit beta